MFERHKHLRRRFICSALLLCALSVAYAEDGAPSYPLELGVYLTNWLVVGPFPNRPAPQEGSAEPVRQGFYHDYLAAMGGETQAVAEAGDAVPGRAGTVFTNILSTTREVDFDTFYGMPDQVVAYALAFVDVEAPTSVFLHVGSDDGIRVWIDSSLVIDSYVERGCRPDEDWAGVFLDKGRHRLLVKVEDSFGSWKFSLRFVGAEEHERIIAAGVRDALDVQLVGPTAEWEQVSVTFATVPALTDFVVTVNGRWLSDDGGVTQGFSVAPGVAAAVPENFAAMPRCKLEAWAGGIVGKEPRACMNLYFTPFDALATNRAAMVENLLAELAATSTTARLAARHEGFLRYSLDQLYAVTSSMRRSTSVEAHRILTGLDRAAEMLSAGVDYLGGRSGEYTAAYLSRADGSGQPFIVNVPVEYKRGIPMPLVVFLHDAGESMSDAFRHVAPAASYIAVRAHARGAGGGYVGLSALDVLDVIDYMTNFYTVDADRISLIGNAMGGYGVWALSAAYPHRFAAVSPLNSYSADLPLANMRNLPTRVIHGDADLVIPVEYSRAAVNFLEPRACPVLYSELKGVGYRLHHAAELVRPIEWLLGQRRMAAPREVVLHSTFSWIERAYWMTILARSNPRRSAHAHGRFFGANEIILYLDNVERAAIELPARFVDPESLLSVVLDGKALELPAPLHDVAYITLGEKGYTLSSERPAPPARRPYRPGSWQNMFNGEPLLLVRGTEGTAACKKRIADCAETVRRWGFVGRAMDSGGLPVKTDDEVTDEDLATRNLILLGGVKENSVVDDIADDLVTPLGADSVTLGGTNESLNGRGLWLCQVNPAHPERLVWIWASSEPAFYDAGAAWIDDWFFPAEDPPDLLVLDVDSSRYDRAVHFTHGWRLDESDMRSPRLGSLFATSNAVAQVVAQVLLDVTDSDCAWLPADMLGAFHDISRLHAAEAAGLIFKGSTILVCDISGAALKRAWDKERESLRTAKAIEPDFADVTDDATFRIALPPRELRSLVEAAKGGISGGRYVQAPLRDILRRMFEDLADRPRKDAGHRSPINYQPSTMNHEQ